MLQGTFETLALPEVLGLLAQSGKTGALWLDAGVSSAVVYLADGRCCAAASTETADPVDTPNALLVRLVDLCFAVARSDDGSFRFGSDAPPWTCPEPVDIEVALDELARLVDEWREIQAAIPSLDCRVRLAEELGVDELTLDRERWQLLVAIDGRRSVRDLARRTGRPVLDLCHAVIALVDAGAATVSQPPVVAGRTTGSGKATRPIVEPEAPYGPGVESPHPGPAGTDGEREEVAAAAKGQYLRVFSGLGEG